VEILELSTVNRRDSSHNGAASNTEPRDTLNPPSAGRFRGLFGLLLCIVGGVILVAGAITLILPNSVHLDVGGVGTDIFFDCGGALYPGTRPSEEPGLTACATRNETMSEMGTSLLAGGAVTLLLGVARLRHSLSHARRPLR
jgi:hypothetical protein